MTVGSQRRPASSLFEWCPVGQLRPVAVLLVAAQWVTDDCVPLEVEAEPAGIRQVGPRRRARSRRYALLCRLRSGATAQRITGRSGASSWAGWCRRTVAWRWKSFGRAGFSLARSDWVIVPGGCRSLLAWRARFAVVVSRPPIPGIHRRASAASVRATVPDSSCAVKSAKKNGKFMVSAGHHRHRGSRPWCPGRRPISHRAAAAADRNCPARRSRIAELPGLGASRRAVRIGVDVPRDSRRARTAALSGHDDLRPKKRRPQLPAGRCSSALSHGYRPVSRPA